MPKNSTSVDRSRHHFVAAVFSSIVCIQRREYRGHGSTVDPPATKSWIENPWCLCLRLDCEHIFCLSMKSKRRTALLSRLPLSPTGLQSILGWKDYSLCLTCHQNVWVAPGGTSPRRPQYLIVQLSCHRGPEALDAVSSVSLWDSEKMPRHRPRIL